MVAEVLSSKKEQFRYEYGRRTGENPVEQQGFFIRKAGPTAWGVAYRIFFEPKEEWVLDSLNKLGYHVTSNNVFCPYENIQFPFLVSSEELFWWLVDYGYKLGENEPINFKQYEEMLNGQGSKRCETDERGDDTEAQSDS